MVQALGPLERICYKKNQVNDLEVSEGLCSVREFCVLGLSKGQGVRGIAPELGFSVTYLGLKKSMEAETVLDKQFCSLKREREVYSPNGAEVDGIKSISGRCLRRSPL